MSRCPGRRLMSSKAMSSTPNDIILHVDMDAFFAAVEQRDRPELQGQPVIVGSPPDQRGVVSTCSYEARRFGVHSAMPSRTAYQKCPEAVFLPVRMERYQAVSRQIMQIFESFSPLVEPLSIDEAFIDVTGAVRLFGDGPAIARQLKARVRTLTGLTCSVGVAPNKFLAKLASECQKPDGLTITPFDPAAIRAFLAPLPINRMWGVGSKTQQILEAHGLHTFRDIQHLSIERLGTYVGVSAATSFKQRALGIDQRPVGNVQREQSISREITFPEDVTDHDRVRMALLDLVEDVGSRLRRAGLYAGTAQLKLRWAGFETATRQRPLTPACYDDAHLREAALTLLARLPITRPVRLIGFGVASLQLDVTNTKGQLLLGLDTAPSDQPKQERVSMTLDLLRARYGPRSIRRASSLVVTSSDSKKGTN